MTALSYRDSQDRYYRDAYRREPSCEHMALLASAGVVRQRARALLDHIDRSCDITRVELHDDARDLRAAIQGYTTPDPTPDTTEQLAQLRHHAQALIDVIADPDLPNLLTYHGGRQQTRARLHTAAEALQGALGGDDA